MDDKTAYSILKIRPGTGKDEISARFEHFIRLYKLYIMGQNIHISPEKIEQMRMAYICLLYKRIEDKELVDLYPQESNSLCHQACSRIIYPLFEKHRAKIIYTIVMSIITYFIVLIMNYKPVDLKVTIFSPPYEMLQNYEIRSLTASALETEISDSIPEIERLSIDYQDYDPNGPSDLFGLFIAGNSDLFIMKEQLLKEFMAAGIRFMTIEKPDIDTAVSANNSMHGDKPGIKIGINKESSIYKKICNLEGDDQPWVAVVSTGVKHKEECLKFLESISGSALRLIKND